MIPLRITERKVAELVLIPLLVPPVSLNDLLSGDIVYPGYEKQLVSKPLLPSDVIFIGSEFVARDFDDGVGFHAPMFAPI